jgi:DNA-directed RNA polymerase specialized sigma subunit
MQYPLSRDEQAAMARYLSGIRKQLQDVSDLFTARYGKNSNIAEIAVKALVSSTLLEHEMLMLENVQEFQFEEEPGERAAGVRY